MQGKKSKNSDNISNKEYFKNHEQIDEVKYNLFMIIHNRCKINEANYDIQLFIIEQEKIKIMINTKNSYSDEYIEYSNIYTLIQFQEITNYFILFENIEEIFEDLIRTIQEKNFSIVHNGNTMTFKIKVMINKKSKDVKSLELKDSKKL